MQNDCAQNTQDIRVAQAQKTHIICAKAPNNTRMSIGGFRQSYPPAQTLQTIILIRHQLLMRNWFKLWADTTLIRKLTREAKRQIANINGPMAHKYWFFYTKTAQTLQKEATIIAANHMKHQLKWHTKTTKYERLPNTALQRAATKSLRFRPGSRTDKKFSRMGQKTLTLQSP